MLTAAAVVQTSFFRTIFTAIDLFGFVTNLQQRTSAATIVNLVQAVEALIAFFAHAFHFFIVTMPILLPEALATRST